MALQYSGEWKFGDFDVSIPDEAVGEFFGLATRSAEGAADPWEVIEVFKSSFGASATSTSQSWAENDLHKAMSASSKNAAAFIDSFWTALGRLEKKGLTLPPAGVLNKVLKKHGVPLAIEPPNLVRTNSDAMIIERDEEGKADPLRGYKLGAELGRGGFGIVYKAVRATSVGEFPFAIKVLDPHPFVQNLKKALARFKREVRVLATLKHRSIVDYVDAGIDQKDRPYLVMQLIEGENFKAAAKAMEPKQLLNALIEIVGALEFAHEQEVFHRDLKPNNIMVRESDGQPILLDFGCAYLLDDADSKSLTTTLVGSLGYIPPEVLADPSIRSPLHDIYSCGIMLYELFGGRRPNLESYAELARIEERFEAIDKVVRHATAPAKKRIETAGELRDALRAARTALGKS